VEGKHTESITCAAAECSHDIGQLISDISVSSSSSSSSSSDDDDDSSSAPSCPPPAVEPFPAVVEGNEVETAAVIVPIFGSGNSDQGYQQVEANGIVTGLRARFRADFRPGQFASIPTGGATNLLSPTLGLYQYFSGFARNGAGTKVGGADKAMWSYDFSVNVTEAGLDLNDVEIFFALDMDPSPDTQFLVFNIFRTKNEGPLALQGWVDNELGTATTGDGEGDPGNPPTETAGKTVVQNSQNYDFIPDPDPSLGLPNFDRDAAGLYELRLIVQDATTGVPLVANTILVDIVADPSIV
jgi:hypothetical protein